MLSAAGLDSARPSVLAAWRFAAPSAGRPWAARSRRHGSRPRDGRTGSRRRPCRRRPRSAARRRRAADRTAGRFRRRRRRRRRGVGAHGARRLVALVRGISRRIRQRGRPSGMEPAPSGVLLRRPGGAAGDRSHGPPGRRVHVGAGRLDRLPGGVRRPRGDAGGTGRRSRAPTAAAPADGGVVPRDARRPAVGVRGRQGVPRRHRSRPHRPHPDGPRRVLPRLRRRLVRRARRRPRRRGDAGQLAHRRRHVRCRSERRPGTTAGRVEHVRADAVDRGVGTSRRVRRAAGAPARPRERPAGGGRPVP